MFALIDEKMDAEKVTWEEDDDGMLPFCDV